MKLEGLWRSLSLPLLLCGCAAHVIGGQSPSSLAEARGAGSSPELDRREAAWLRAYEQHDPTSMDAILAPGFTITYPNGQVLSREDVIAQVTEPSSRRAPRFTTEEVVTRRLGDVAVRTGVLVTETSRGRTRHRYTDTWLRHEGGWRVVASHLSTLAAD